MRHDEVASGPICYLADAWIGSTRTQVAFEHSRSAPETKHKFKLSV